MKRHILAIALLLIIFPNLLSAQEQKPIRMHEIGLRFSSFDNFGLVYKTGRKTTLLRLSVVALNLNHNNTWGRTQDSLERKETGYGAAMKMGFEKRIPIVKNLNFFAGIDAGIGYNYEQGKVSGTVYSYSYDGSSWQVMPSISCVLGASLIVKEILVVSAEINPSLTYIYGKSKQKTNNNKETLTTTSNVQFGLSNSWAAITIAYRFGK